MCKADIRVIKKIIIKCNSDCDYYDSLDGVAYCIHPFNEYMLITSEEFPLDCPL